MKVDQAAPPNRRRPGPAAMYGTFTRTSAESGTLVSTHALAPPSSELETNPRASRRLAAPLSIYYPGTLVSTHALEQSSRA